ncbi:MAG: S24 family peptidase [Granulosicoccaceae bacterium]
MSENKIVFFKSLSDKKASDDIQRLEPSTCTEAETFVLQVLDDSMEPEFRQDCMIVIDPTGHATDGSYVLAQRKQATDPNHTESEGPEKLVEQYHFRQLRRDDYQSWQLCALNDAYPSESTPDDLSEIVGVIVQRAGTRRRYHKRYD